MANLHEAAAELRFFAEYNDVDGMIGAASRVATCATHLLGPEAILSSRTTELLVAMLEQARPDAQAAACVAITAIARFDEIQLEVVAQEGTELLVAILADGQPEAQLEACRACKAIARHRDGREALAQTGAVRALLRVARDARHVAHGDAAAALALVVGLEGSATSTAILATAAASAKAQNATASDGGAGGGGRAGASGSTGSSAAHSRRTRAAGHGKPSGSVSMDAAGPADAVAAAGSEAIESFVLMAQGGGATAREQAAHGLRHLCRTDDSRRRLVRAGAIEALLSCADHWRVEVPRAAAAALYELTAEPEAATHLPMAMLPAARSPDGLQPSGFMDPSTTDGGHVDGLAILHFLSCSRDGATKLASFRTLANLCAQPANAALLLRAGVLGQMCNLLVQDAPAEHQHAATRALGHLVGHAPITPGMLLHNGLLRELIGAARGKRHLGRQAALELKTLGLFALAQLAGRRYLHETLVSGAVPHALVEIADSTPHATAQRSLMLALLRLLRKPHSTSRVQLLRSSGAVATLRSMFRTKSNEEDVRSSAALALCFIAADAQCHLPAGQPLKHEQTALASMDKQYASSAIAAASLSSGLAPTPHVATSAGDGVGVARGSRAGERQPLRNMQLHGPAEQADEEQTADDDDFFAGIVTALSDDNLRTLGLQALALLALRWEFHAHVFGEASGEQQYGLGLISMIVKIARQRESRADADTTAQRWAALVLSNLNAARELRFSARHALPLSTGATVVADASELAALATALSSASIDVVRVAVGALSSLSASHGANRERIAARHCLSSLLLLAQRDVVSVQRDALRTITAVALQVSAKEELVSEGALPLLLGLLEATLNIPPSAPNLRAIQFARLVSTRRQCACALANLSEGHLRVQAAIVQHGTTLRQLIQPLQRHNAAVSAVEARAATGPPRTAHEEAAAAVAEAAEAGVRLDESTRCQLLRCLANVCLNDANHDAILKSALLSELPSCAKRGCGAERRLCALVMSNLAANPLSHPTLTAADLLQLLVNLVTGPGEHAGSEHAAEDNENDAIDTAEVTEERWLDEAEASAWEPAGVVVDGTSPRRSTRVMALQTISELSSSEETHLQLVRAGFVRALLPLAAPHHSKHTSGVEGRGAGALAKTRAFLLAAWPFASGRPSGGVDGAHGEPSGASQVADDGYGQPSEDERMEAIVALANLAENPDTHDAAFVGLEGSKAFELFVTLIQAPTAAEQREGFRALSCLALARSRAAASTGGGAIDSSLMELLLNKATQALEPQPDGRSSDEEVAFHAARALALLSTNQANRRLIVEHGGLPIMYALARQPDTDIQAEAATVIANVTTSSYEAQTRVVADGVVQLLVYLCSSQHEEVRAASARAIANLTQNIDNESTLRAARCYKALVRNVEVGSADVKLQSRRALANLEAARLLVGLRRFGGREVVLAEPGVVTDICRHADAANVGSQREVARALANLAAAEENHAALVAEGGLATCMDLVVSNSPEVQQQATRAIGNLALAADDSVPAHMVDEGVLELLVLLAASWDEGVQQEASIALASFAERPRHRTAVIRAGAFEKLLEQLKSPSAAVRYHGALALMAIQ